MSKMLVAAFSDPDQADLAVESLEDKGYSPQELSVITNDSETYALSQSSENDLVGVLIGLGVSYVDADRYDKAARGGGVVLGIPVQSLVKLAETRSMLVRHGAAGTSEIDVHENG